MTYPSCDYTLNEFQKDAKRTANKGQDRLTRLATCALGFWEAGEFGNHVKKAFAHGHQIDRQYLAKELGDILWYVADAADALEFDLEDVAKRVIAKLRRRYPDGFSHEASINRQPQNE